MPALEKDEPKKEVHRVSERRKNWHFVFFCFFSDGSAKGMRSFAVLRPSHDDVNIAGVVGDRSIE
jgi:hypothetical protein